jgi:hypothetical protein
LTDFRDFESEDEMQPGTTPFRDPIEGAMARRRDLLRSRRDDFVEMPDAIRRVYVARWGRIGAAAGAALFGGVMLALIVAQLLPSALGPALLRLAQAVLPGETPAAVATLAAGAWMAAGFGTLLARALAERAFARRTARCVFPSDDVYQDVEKLQHVTPADVGRSLALGVESTSVALPLLALALILPPAALYLFEAIAARGYPHVGSFEDMLLARGAGLAALALAAVLLSAILRIGLRSWTTRRLGRAALLVAGVGAAIAAVVGAAVRLDGGPNLYPLLGAGVGAISMLAAGFLLLVRRERAALGLADSDVAALDDSVGRSLGNIGRILGGALGAGGRAFAASPIGRAGARLLRTRPGALVRRPLVLAAASFAAGILAFQALASRPVPPPPAATQARPAPTTPGASTLLPAGTVGGKMIMDLTFDGEAPGPAYFPALELPPLFEPGLGWRVTVRASRSGFDSLRRDAYLGLSPHPDQPVLYADWSFDLGCQEAPLIEWRAEPGGDWPSGPQTVQFSWTFDATPCEL